ncbi:flagellar hook-length control protein FliK [Metapseudomonas boanensis]|uniref:Flagellar hook-length control protein FliK n=1 Tax=Metapseudomonas boanensis TaxID=2822138 RepID=A0ABS5XHB1_9GAMM|nr:flagellar hook-length control protein FliK [Pseudomonas boanensis]MBT8766430.1 flagellar hook-length control protein FliK [Pseudomonas boanensis]
MPVAPNLLLQATPDVKPKAPVAKAPEKTAQANNGEASSFARMYAKERQATAAECKEPAETGQPDEAGQPVAEAADRAESVAESGNALPAEEVDDPQVQGEPVIDPMLLMAMVEQLPSEAAETQPASGASVIGPASPVVAADQVSPEQSSAALEGLPVMPTVALPDSATPRILGESSQAPEQVSPDTRPAVKMAMEQLAQSAQSTPQVQGTNQQSATSAEFASALSAFADQPVEDGELQLEGELSVAEHSGGLGEALGESSSDARSEVLASRLSALSQAIGQPVAQAQRTPNLVPGQPVALQQGGWSEAVVDRVMWLSSQNLKSAEIQLDPAELGRLEVRVHMTQDQAQVTFASPNAGVRDALEGQMHRLRDLFAQQGMNQLDVSVSDQSLGRGWQGQGGDAERRGGGARADFGGVGDEDPSVSVSEIRSASVGAGRGLVDYYA